MNVETLNINSMQIAELTADNYIITGIEDGSDLAGNLYYQYFDGGIIYQKNIVPDFFDLKTGIAGEILQKFSNFRLRLVIVGSFSNLTSKSLRDFINESNTGKLINFATNRKEAIRLLSAI